MAAHREEVNWVPRSEVIRRGRPNLDTQLKRKARQMVMVEVSAMGIASGHLEKRSTIVRRWEKPLEGGSGPTRSRWMCSKRAAGMGIRWTAGRVWRTIFDR